VYQVGDPARHTGRGEFQVVRDPGMPLVYAGFGLLLAGLVVTLYVNPWLNSRRTLA
jgi:cytochrome c biogenesis protein ResB